MALDDKDAKICIQRWPGHGLILKPEPLVYRPPWFLLLARRLPMRVSLVLVGRSFGNLSLISAFCFVFVKVERVEPHWRRARPKEWVDDGVSTNHSYTPSLLPSIYRHPVASIDSRSLVIRLTSTMRFATTLAAVITTLAVPAALALRGTGHQHPVSVYLHPTPGHHHGSVPTLTGEQAEVVFAHHFGIGLNEEEYQKYLSGGIAVNDPIEGGHGSAPLATTEQPKVIVIQGDVQISDILPSSIPHRPAFKLPAFPDAETMRFVQPYLMQGQVTVARFLETVKDNLEQGFDQIWSTVQGSKAGKWVGDAFDINTSRESRPVAPCDLSCQLQALTKSSCDLRLLRLSSGPPRRTLSPLRIRRQPSKAFILVLIRIEQQDG